MISVGILLRKRMEKMPKEELMSKCLIYIRCMIFCRLQYSSTSAVKNKLSRFSFFFFGQAVDDISNVESLQYEIEKIKAATNGFSEANKLGQGGFGSVYRVNN